MNPLHEIAELKAKRDALERALAQQDMSEADKDRFTIRIVAITNELSMCDARLPQDGDPITWETFYKRRADYFERAFTAFALGGGAWLWAKRMGFSQYQQRWTAGASAIATSLFKKNNGNKNQ